MLVDEEDDLEGEHEIGKMVAEILKLEEGSVNSRKTAFSPSSASPVTRAPRLGDLARSHIAMDAVDSVVDPLREFAKDSVRLVKRCHKPDRKEFTKVAARTAIGFVVMGFVGFFVKLIFIPINNIIVGSG
uniref:Uncharacterized protein n=1 Tax=Avena sativa TaxID=4498 RepID=A0ACD6AF95_AVESA